MKRLSLLVLTLCLTLVVGVSAGFAAEAKKDPLAVWKANFDPSGTEYTYILSNISHPVIEGVGAGYRIRDRVWEASKGRLFVDFRPLAQLGGEKDVINKAQARGRARHAELFGGSTECCRHPRQARHLPQHSGALAALC